MTEIEQDLLSGYIDETGKIIIELDDCKEKEINWEELGGDYWKKKMIDKLPFYEIHHGIDIEYTEYEKLPIKLETLMKIDFNVGGWFIFTKNDRWAYRFK